MPGEDWLAAGIRLANTVVMADSQRRLLNVQIARAQQNLPPLDTSQYGVGVNVGLSPDTMKLLGFGALGLVALMLLGRRGR